MPAAQQRDESEPDFLLFADDDSLDIRSYLLAEILDLGHDSLFRTRRWVVIRERVTEPVIARHPSPLEGRRSQHTNR